MTAAFFQQVCTIACGFRFGKGIAECFSKNPWIGHLGAGIGYAAAAAIVRKALDEKEKAISTTNEGSVTITIAEAEAYVKEHPDKNFADLWIEKERKRAENGIESVQVR